MGEFGELLRNARAYRGVSLHDAERATRISRRYLAALEQEAFEHLPPLTYARGIVRIYAQYLGLDPVAVLAKFEDAHGQRSLGFRVVPSARTVQEPLMHWAPNFAVIAFMLAISAIVFALVYTTYLAPRETVGPPSLASTSEPAAPPSTTTPGSTPTTAEIGTPSPPAGVSSQPSPTLENPTSPVHATAPASPTPPPASQAPAPAATPSTRTEHVFEIVVVGRVWVQATVDGQTVVAEVLDAGARRVFRGSTMTVSSGNAPLVRVLVDGEDRGPLGQRWDDTASYP